MLLFVSASSQLCPVNVLSFAKYDNTVPAIIPIANWPCILSNDAVTATGEKVRKRHTIKPNYVPFVSEEYLIPESPEAALRIIDEMALDLVKKKENVFVYMVKEIAGWYIPQGSQVSMSDIVTVRNNIVQTQIGSPVSMYVSMKTWCDWKVKMLDWVTESYRTNEESQGNVLMGIPVVVRANYLFEDVTSAIMVGPLSRHSCLDPLVEIEVIDGAKMCGHHHCSIIIPQNDVVMIREKGR